LAIIIINIVVAFPDALVIKGVLGDDDAFDVALPIGSDVIGTSGTLRAGGTLRASRPAGPRLHAKSVSVRTTKSCTKPYFIPY